jgi:hypothetical protein
MEKKKDSSDVIGKTYFEYSIYLEEIPEGEQTFSFIFPNYELDPDNSSGMMILSECTSSAVIKQNLNDFMYSTVDIDNLYVGTDSTTNPENIALVHYVVYDVPVVKKDYYDSLNITDKNLFTALVLQKIVTFDVSQYKMLTDNISIKFSDTTGYLTNMRNNKPTKSAVLGINPTSIPENPTIGDRYAVSDEQNPWSVSPWKQEPPFVAQAIGSYDSTGALIDIAWAFDRIIKNDIIEVIPDPTNPDSSYIVLYTGSKLVDPVVKIPFTIKMIIWKKATSSMTNQTLSQKIKDTLIQTFYNKFGYDQTIYRSEIIRAVKSISDVENCELLEPQFDIFFNYDPYVDFDEKKLLQFSPQLCYFDTKSIVLDIRVA